MILFFKKLPSYGSVALLPDQVQHIKAKRILKEDSQIILSDGSFFVHAVLEGRAPQIIAKYTSCLYPIDPRTDRMVLCFGLIKPDRMSWLVEKAVELGVDRLVPLITERSQNNYWTPSSRQHLEKVIVSACTQSLQYSLPVLDSPLTLEDSLKKNDAVASFYGSLQDTSSKNIPFANPQQTSLKLYIGPEGGWSPQEDLLLKEHASPLYYPGPVLRTETAAIALTIILKEKLESLINRA